MQPGSRRRRWWLGASRSKRNWRQWACSPTWKFSHPTLSASSPRNSASTWRMLACKSGITGRMWSKRKETESDLPFFRIFVSGKQDEPKGCLPRSVQISRTTHSDYLNTPIGIIWTRHRDYPDSMKRLSERPVADPSRLGCQEHKNKSGVPLWGQKLNKIWPRINQNDFVQFWNEFWIISPRQRTQRH